MLIPQKGQTFILVTVKLNISKVLGPFQNGITIRCIHTELHFVVWTSIKRSKFCQHPPVIHSLCEKKAKCSVSEVYFMEPTHKDQRRLLFFPNLNVVAFLDHSFLDWKFGGGYTWQSILKKMTVSYSWSRLHEKDTEC